MLRKISIAKDSISRGSGIGSGMPTKQGCQSIYFERLRQSESFAKRI